MNHDQAIDAFVLAVIQRAHDSVIATSLRYMKEGPPGRAPSQEWVALHHWFMSLGPTEQRHMAVSVELAVDAAVFGVLAVIDGVAGNFVPGRLTELSLTLHLTDETEEDPIGGATTIDLVSEETGPRLHDAYKSIINERKARQES